MAGGKIRGITVEIGGDTTKLGKALESVNKNTRDLQSELKGVESLLKMDPGNVDLLAQRQEILTRAIEETTKKLDTLQGVQKEVQTKWENYGKVKPQLDKIANEIEETQKQLKKLQKQQEEATAAFEAGEISEEQYREITDAVKECQDRLKTLKKEQSDLSRKVVNDEQYRDFQREIIATNAQLSDFKNELKSVNAVADTSKAVSEYDKLTEKIEKQESQLSALRDAYAKVVVEHGKSSKEAKALRSEMDTLNDELAENKKVLNSAESEAKKYSSALDDVGDSAGGTSDGFTIMGGALADLVSSAIQSAISAIGDLVGALFELSEATEEYRTMQAKLAGSADTFGYSVEFANSKYQEFYKYLGDDQMATNAITNLMGLGTSTENVSALAESAIAVWSAYGDSIPIEALTESINETAQVGQVTGNLADALNWAGISEDSFNEKLEKCNGTKERADLIAKTLNDTYGESKARYDELNGSVTAANEAELKLKDTQAQLGETMAPVNTALTELKNQALQAILPLVQALASAFLDLLNWLKEHPTVMAILTGVVLALAVAFGVLAIALGIQALINGVTMAFSLLNLTMLANPYVLIAALIAAIVAALIYLWTSCDGFREFWINLWEKITTFCGNAIDAVVKFFKELPGKIKTWFDKIITDIKTWGKNLKDKATSAAKDAINSVTSWFKQLPGKISSAIQGAISRVTTWGSDLKNKAVSAVTSMVSNVVSKAQQIPGKIASAIQGAVSRVKSWGSSLISAAGSAIQNMVNRVVSIASSLPGKFIQIGRNIIQGISNGISSAVSGLYSTIKNALSGLVQKAKNALGINSPSKVFADTVGVGIPEGIAKGIDDNVGIAENAVVNMTDDLSDQAANFNGATINRKLAATFSANAGGVTDNNSALLSKLDGIYDRLNRLQIVLDSGTLVGETIDQIDAALASKQILSARGV